MTNLYDQGGRLMQHSVYSGSCGGDETREDYTYAPDGSRTTKSSQTRGEDSPSPPAAARGNNRGGNVGLRTVFKYDAAGKLTEAASVKLGGDVPYKYTYSYDSKGRIVETSSYENGHISDRRVYVYSGDGNVPSGISYYGSDGKVYERTFYTEYEFNSHGDWIRRKETTEETFNRKSISITLREIEYYPDLR